MARNLSTQQKHNLLELIKQGFKTRELRTALGVSSSTISRLKRNAGMELGSQNREGSTSVYLFSHDRPIDNFGGAF